MTRARDLADFNLDGKAVTINESSADLDFRVESNGNANMFVVDGGNDRIGIGTNSPDTMLHISAASSARLRLQDTTNDVKTDILVGDTSSVIGNASNHDLAFMTNDTNRMTITSGGGVAIKGTDPDPTGDGTAARAFLAVQGTLNRGCLALGTTSNSGGDVAALRFNNGSNVVASIGVDSDSGSTSTGKMLFFTGGTQRAIIDSSGNVGIGTTSGGAKLDVRRSDNEQVGFFLNENSGFSSTTVGISTSRNTTGGAYNHLTCSIHGVAVKFVVYDSGNVVNTNNSYGQISDQRLKENIVDASSQWNDIKSLQVRNFNFIGDDLTQIGVVAQEVEAAGMNGLIQESAWFDAASNPDSEIRKTVKYSVLYMKAVKALQEAMTRIETLETEMTALKARVTTLEGE
jgi:hypothetical protein